MERNVATSFWFIAALDPAASTRTMADNREFAGFGVVSAKISEGAECISLSLV
jgi:hypothetical protein